MAHCAEIVDGVVVRVVVISNDYEPNVEEFAVELFGGIWKQTSYNGNIRFNYAGIGYTYDEARDAFIAPKTNCHDEEIFNESNCQWNCSNPEHNVDLS